MKNLLLSVIGCFLFSFSTAQSQTIDEATHLLDVWLDAQKDYNDWPSLSVSFIHDQDLIYAKSVGHANPNKIIKATPDTLYRIASLSKLFTSISIMQLRDAGKLNLNDPVQKHLKWYGIKQKYPLSDDVTIAGLLTHSSGLPRELDTPYWSYRRGYPFPDLDELIAVSSKQETLYRAWDRYQYSNLAFMLLGQVVATASNMDYHEYVLENVLKPMKLTNTFSDIDKSKHGKELAIGYGALNRNRDRMEVPFIDAKATASAAGFSSSAKDLAKFAMWQLKLLHGNGDDVLDQNSLREMMRPHSVTANLDNAVGYGFQLYNRDGKKYIGHSGGFMGFQSHYLIEPDQKIGAVALMSGHSTSPHQLVRRVMAILGPVINNPKVYNPPVALEDYQGIYDQQPWGDEIYVTPWGNHLASFNLDTDNPAEAITKLQHVSGDNFARVRKDGTLAELTKFIRDENGVIISFINQGDEIVKKN